MFLAKIKKNPLLKAFYNLPGLASLYHFSLACFGAFFYGFPGKKIFVIGVTGTKGKTTVLELLDFILKTAGKKTALLSSLRIKIGEKTEKNKLGNSMPGRFYIQKFLYRAAKAGCKYALIEVTSQGVAMHRHRFINWNAGILTNIAPEHIESHGSFEKYRAAKLSFLRYVARKRGKIFLNKDDPGSAFFFAALKKFNPIAYSRGSMGGALAEASAVRSAGDQSATDFISSDFNKENIAAAAALASGLGIGWAAIKEAISNFSGVPGRMEFIRKHGIVAVVDYAHTPDSLKKVYTFLRERISKSESQKADHSPFAPNSKLICVLGSAGGGRDKWTRPEMGRIAGEYCDEIILTNEDPYDEKPSQILQEIKTGISNSQIPISSVYEVIDRKEAIQKAASLARERDVIVCTGKGSEDWIYLAKGKRIPWNERQVVEEVLNAR